MNWLNWLLSATILLYVLGLLHSIFGFCRKRQVFVRLALGMVAAGFACHTVFLAVLGLARGHLPITNLSESLCFFAWCVSLAFMAASVRYRIHALGAFSLPLVSVLTVLSQIVWDEHHTIPEFLKSGWVYFHAGIAFVAYASFFLTFVAGVLYLVQEKELKGKNFRFLYFRLPPLQVCDELMRRFLFTGFVAMSLTIISGAIWAQHAWGRFWGWDPKETAALVTWAIYFVLVNYRLSSRWRTRRAAWISIAGLASALVTFGVNWGLHRYL
ncbi:MAG: cytochrome c biogenesis protein CcsA [Acidobacteriota bacterium]|jgi:cytochrome c-type biogenesis protein CcsB|nr:cytochrome c biogenesis protein CcsA [Acidobacteriota bacterium]